MGPGWTEVGAGVGGVRVWVGGRGWVGWSGEGLELGGGGGRGEVLVPGLRRGGGWGGWCEEGRKGLLGERRCSRSLLVSLAVKCETGR